MSKSTSVYLDQTNTSGLIKTCIAFIVIDTLFIALRFFSRYNQRAAFGWDDALMAGGWLVCVGLCIDGLIAPSFGIGTRFEKVVATTPEKIPHWGRNGFYAIPILYCVAVTLPKMSVLVLYLRIFVDRLSRLCCWALLGALAVTAVVNIFVVAFQCNTTTAAWDPELPGRHCGNIQAHLTYSGIPNIVTDIAMLILPIPVVLRLQVSTEVKIGLVVTFLLASTGLVTAIIRLVQFIQDTYASDPTYNAAPLIIWIVVETSIYLVSGCLLSCRPALKKLVIKNNLSSFTSWLRKSWARTYLASRSEHTHQSGLPSGQHGSHEASVGEGDFYKLDSNMKQKIHVQNEVNVESSSLDV